jgi:mRNA interferase RelE/StbE
LLYHVEISPAALRQLRKLEAPVRRRILTKIESLGINPRPPGVAKLYDTEDLYRVRVGEFRIIYAIEDQVAIVLVVKIGNRKEIYR